jgi:DNA-binding response OmpR family regulator
MTALAVYCVADHALMGCPQAPEPVHFTAQQAKILGLLIQRMGRVVRKETLFCELYSGANDEPDYGIGVIRIQIMRLRRKLKTAGAPIEITCIWGVGYRATGYIEIDWTGL